MKQDKEMEQINAVYEKCGLLTRDGNFKKRIDVPEIPKITYGNVELKMNTNKSILK